MKAGTGDTTSARFGDDSRRTVRVRTRLRSAKIFGERGAFLAECSVFDISASGARLRLFGKIGLAIPHRVRIFDEVEKTMRDGEVVWRGAARVLGVRFL